MSIMTCLTFLRVVPFENVNILATVSRQLVFPSNRQVRMTVIATLLQNQFCLMESRVAHFWHDLRALRNRQIDKISYHACDIS